MDMEERERRVKKVRRYLIALLAALAISAAMMHSTGLFVGGHTMATVMMLLSDAFFVPGVILLGFGLLMWVAGEGMFDMMSYGVKLLWDVAYKHEWESFRDYRMRKAEKERTPVGHLILVGLVFVLLGALFTGLFYVYAG